MDVQTIETHRLVTTLAVPLYTPPLQSYLGYYVSQLHKTRHQTLISRLSSGHKHVLVLGLNITFGRECFTWPSWIHPSVLHLMTHILQYWSILHTITYNYLTHTFYRRTRVFVCICEACYTLPGSTGISIERGASVCVDPAASRHYGALGGPCRAGAFYIVMMYWYHSGG